jgi:hypothetical protein
VLDLPQILAGPRTTEPPHYPVASGGRRPYSLESMLRVHLMQNWFALSDPAMEAALYEIVPHSASCRRLPW